MITSWIKKIREGKPLNASEQILLSMIEDINTGVFDANISANMVETCGHIVTRGYRFQKPHHFMDGMTVSYEVYFEGHALEVTHWRINDHEIRYKIKSDLYDAMVDAVERAHKRQDTARDKEFMEYLRERKRRRGCTHQD